MLKLTEFKKFESVPELKPGIWLIGFDSKGYPIIYKPVQDEWVGSSGNLTPNTPCSRLFCLAPVGEELTNEPETIWIEPYVGAKTGYLEPTIHVTRFRR